jgi:hypothetical protein
MALSKGQIETYWIRNGGNKSKAPLMAAIALAESGGNVNSVNPEGPEHAEGLWQIKGQIVPGNPLDPNVSAKNAIAKLNSQGLGAWVTYTNGAYKKYLGEGEAFTLPGQESLEHLFGGGVNHPGPITSGARSATKTVESSAQVWAVIGEWLGNPTRLGKLIAGGALLYMGLHSLTAGTAAEGAVEAPAKLAKKLGGAAVGVATDGGSTAAKKAMKQAMKLKKKTTKPPAKAAAKKPAKTTTKGSKMKPMRQPSNTSSTSKPKGGK